MTTWAVSVGFGIVRKLSLTLKKIVMKMQDFSVSVDLSVFIGDLETEGYLSDLDTDDYDM